MPVHPVVARVTERIVARSAPPRAAYLAELARTEAAGPRRAAHGCGNLAHAVAACPRRDKDRLVSGDAVNVGIVTAYNDVLSAHQPFATYPDRIKRALVDVGAVGQVAGGVPAM